MIFPWLNKISHALRSFAQILHSLSSLVTLRPPTYLDTTKKVFWAVDISTLATEKVHHIPQCKLIHWHLVYISVSWLAWISLPKLVKLWTLMKMKILTLQNCEPDPQRSLILPQTSISPKRLQNHQPPHLPPLCSDELQNLYLQSYCLILQYTLIANVN